MVEQDTDTPEAVTPTKLEELLESSELQEEVERIINQMLTAGRSGSAWAPDSPFFHTHTTTEDAIITALIFG